VSVAAQGVCVHETGHTTKGWLADTAKISTSAASQRLRVAERLHLSYPTLVEAFRAGRIGWQHIATFDKAANARNRADLVEFIPSLIDLAEVATFDRWAQELRGIATQLDQDGGYDPTQDPSNNRLRLSPLINGIMTITGQLTGELALMAETLLNTQTDQVLARYRNDATNAGDETSGELIDPPARSQAMAEALIDLLERGTTVPDGTGALLQPELVVIYDETTNQLTDTNGATISQSLLRWIVAAAIIRPLELTNTGDPLRMGRLLRYANRHQRRALTIRDGGCVFPGCTRPAHWCDAHHVDEWDDGGATDLENMALLCRHHHRVTHRPGWTMSRWMSDELEPGEIRFQWQTPAGRTIYSQRHHQRRERAPAA
jgi:hypothetical protein